MKVVVPLNEDAGQGSKVCDHFGSAPYYAFADTEVGSIEIIPNAAMSHNHGQCTPTDLFSGRGIGAVLCNGIGAGAIAKLQMLGIDVYMAALAPTLEEAIARFSSGILTKANVQKACQGHDCH